MRNELKVPQSFMLLGSTIRVETVDELLDEEGGNCLGKCFFNELKIVLNVGKEGITNPDTFYHTFKHETAHMLLHFMGEKRLCLNEKVVDLLGGLLHQIDITAEGVVKLPE